MLPCLTHAALYQGRLVSYATDSGALLRSDRALLSPCLCKKVWAQTAEREGYEWEKRSVSILPSDPSSWPDNMACRGQTRNATGTGKDSNPAIGAKPLTWSHSLARCQVPPERNRIGRPPTHLSARHPASIRIPPSFAYTQHCPLPTLLPSSAVYRRNVLFNVPVTRICSKRPILSDIEPIKSPRGFVMIPFFSCAPTTSSTLLSRYLAPHQQ